jgi:NitT/TauT family transport system substrate-binding protein
MTGFGSRRASAASGVLAVLVVAALFDHGLLGRVGDAQPVGGGLETRTVRIGLVVPAASFLPIYLLAERALGDEGLTVEIVTLRGASTLSQALVSGAVDVGVAGLGQLVTMINAGHAVRTFFYAGVMHAEYEWFANPGIRTWADVRGKRIGITTLGSLTHWFTRHALRRHGLHPERDAQFVQVGGSPTAFQALRADRVDVAILAPPFRWQAAAEGFRKLGDEASEIGDEWPRNTYMAKQGFLDAHPRTVRALLRAHVRAIRAVRADRELAVRTLMQALKYEREYAERAYDEVVGNLNERGTLPAKGVQVFFELARVEGEVTEPWPEARFLDRRFIDTFEQWAPPR